MQKTNRKGIILAGGNGTRLYPATLAISKQLLPVYDKPMIYYSIATLMLANIKDILIISTPNDINNFKRLLGNGDNLGLNFSYKIQNKPEGIAQSFLIAEDFINNSNCALILGDNIFYSSYLQNSLNNIDNNGATIFAYRVKNPQDYGVIELYNKEDKKNEKNILNIEEKPENPKSNLAVTGLYFYDNQVIKFAKSLKPSKRGELEITDINNLYLKNNNLNLKILPRGSAWLDMGTHDNLLEASQFIATLEHRQGLKIACLEEISFRLGFINKEQLKKLIRPFLNNDYGKYLQQILLEN